MYICKVIKQVHPDMGNSAKGMGVMNSERTADALSSTMKHEHKGYSKLGTRTVLQCRVLR